jgi:hypothetical protein
MGKDDTVAADPDAQDRRTTGRRTGSLSGAMAMVFVGGSVSVSSRLVQAPVLAAESLRYAAASLMLVAFARASRRRVLMPRGVESQQVVYEGVS